MFYRRTHAMRRAVSVLFSSVALGNPASVRGGCGCSSMAPPLVGLALALMLRWKRRLARLTHSNGTGGVEPHSARSTR